MLYSDLRLLNENPSWRLVLEAYLASTLEAAEARAAERNQAKAAAKQAGEQDEAAIIDTAEEPPDEESDETASFAQDRWLSRVSVVHEVPADELSTIHGHLIAHGFLKFQLAGRDGLVYQLTSLGRRGAEMASEGVPDETDDSVEEVVEDALEDAA